MQAPSELTTIRDYLRWSVSQFNEFGLFYGHGTDNAWDEAAYLILRSLHLPHDTHPSFYDATLTIKERDLLNKQLHRRVHERLPTAYLIHEAWFAEMAFYVDERVLIPRSPIAELIQQGFEPWIESEQVTDILDLCTGSGCIAIACAKAFPEAHIDASDLSHDALAVAKINVTRHEVEKHVTLYQSDLFDSLPMKQYDIIVSNPPYVDAADMAALPKEYHHEPSLGLQAGQDGLDIAIMILKNAHRYLKSNGILVVEVGNSETALTEKYPEIPFTWIEFENDSGGVFMLTAEQCKELAV